MSDPTRAADRQPLPSRLIATPWFAIVVTMIVWGGNVVVARGAAGDVSPFALVTLRWLVVCALLLVFAPGRAAAALKQLRPHWAYVGPMGALGFTASNALFFGGAKFTSGLNIAIVAAAVPVLVILGARIAWGSRIGAKRMAGVALTILGVLVVATRGDLAAIGALRFNFGDLLEFTGAATYAAFTVALRRKPGISAFAFFIGIAISAFIACLPGLAWEIVAGAIVWPNARGWAAIVYVAIFTSIVGQMMWIRAVELIGPSRAGVFQNLVPIIGAGLSVLVLGEDLRWFHAAALALVLAGIWVAERRGA